MKHVRSLIAMLLITVLMLSITSCGRAPASDYDLDVGDENPNILGEWSIKKKEDDGEVYLIISHHGECEEDMDYLAFTVFDSPKAAAKEFEEISDDLDGRIKDSGDNWLTAEMPDCYDATITGMYYLEENIIIYTMIDIISEWPVDPDYEPEPVPDQYVFDRMELKDYILGNSPAIRDYVLDEILTGTDPAEESEMSRNSLISELESIGRHTYTGPGGYEICKIYSTEVLDGIINGDEMPVRVTYTAIGEDGPDSWSSEDPAVITGFIEALRLVKINRIVTDPDEMGYAADCTKQITFDLEDDTSFMLDLDEGFRIHEKDVVYEITELDALYGMYDQIMQQP